MRNCLSPGTGFSRARLAAQLGARGLMVALAWLALSAGMSARADNAGQDDLDKATEVKMKSHTFSDLGEVISLCESAMKKGLDKDNESFAKMMLAATLIQRGTMIAKSIADEGAPDPNWAKLRELALVDLEKAVKIDAKQAEALMYIANLNLLPGGNAKRAREALDQAIAAADDLPDIKAKCLLRRAQSTDDLKKRRVDLDEAVKLASGNPQVVFARALVLADQGETKEALADLDRVLELKEDFPGVLEVKAVVLTQAKRFDEALLQLQKSREANPKSPFPLVQRARVMLAQGKLESAVRDLDVAESLDPSDVSVLLLRATIYHDLKKNDKAMADVDRALRLKPSHQPAMRVKAALLAGEGKIDEAIGQLEKFYHENPGDANSLAQLAMFYSSEEKFDKAIETYSAVLAKDPKNFLALRGRGDALLGVGRHADAIADYERALAVDPDESGLLNNFAWVLATSPDDKLRNGPRAIKLATAACKSTEYKQSHILSTLAAAYAETGDFTKALEFSEKSVEAATGDQKESLRKELETYKAGKPMRERKTAEDKKPEAKSEAKPKAADTKDAKPADKKVEKKTSTKKKTPAEKQTPAAKPNVEAGAAPKPESSAK